MNIPYLENSSETMLDEHDARHGLQHSSIRKTVKISELHSGTVQREGVYDYIVLIVKNY